MPILANWWGLPVIYEDTGAPYYDESNYQIEFEIQLETTIKRIPITVFGFGAWVDIVNGSYLSAMSMTNKVMYNVPKREVGERV